MQTPLSNAESGSTSEPKAPQSLTKFEAWKPAQISRAAIKNAPYNPRQITDTAKHRLREGIKNVGLVQPIVWNRRTGNIVGGHQRISQLDALEGSKDYLITVAELDVDDIREKELNILLNNSNVTGDWDFAELKKLLDTTGLDIGNAGFGAADIMQMFGEAIGASTPAQEELAKQLSKVKDAYTRLDNAAASKDDTDFYAIVIFRSHPDRLAFFEKVKLPDNRYVNGDYLASRIEQAKPALKGEGLDGPDVLENPSVVAGEVPLPMTLHGEEIVVNDVNEVN